MKNYLKFWGTRGSCSVSGPQYAQFGGNSCCLEVSYEGTHILIDAGTGIRPAGEVLIQEGAKKIDLFLGHFHWDHVIGLPFFDPLYHKDFEITIWGPETTGKNCREIFKQLLSPDFFPVHFDEIQAKLNFRTIQENSPVRFGKITLDFHKTNHPGPTFCFKITTPKQTITYVTDNEVLEGFQGTFNEMTDELLKKHWSLIQFLKNSDILIHEAQYEADEYAHKSGWGHSSLTNSMALLKQVAPKKWLVTHHDPKHNDKTLQEMSKQAKLLLKTNLIHCDVEWIGDQYVLPL